MKNWLFRALSVLALAAVIVADRYPAYWAICAVIATLSSLAVLAMRLTENSSALADCERTSEPQPQEQFDFQKAYAEVLKPTSPTEKVDDSAFNPYLLLRYYTWHQASSPLAPLSPATRLVLMSNDFRNFIRRDIVSISTQEGRKLDEIVAQQRQLELKIKQSEETQKELVRLMRQLVKSGSERNLSGVHWNIDSLEDPPSSLH